MEQAWKQLLREFDLWPLEGVSEYTVPIPNLPYQRPDGKIMTRQGQERSILEHKAIVNNGVNCIIQKGIRTKDKTKTQIAIKRPRYTHQHLRLEAFVQALAHSILARAGIHGAIPKPFDIFTFANEVRFTMEWVEGKSSYDFLYNLLDNVPKFQIAFLHILAQTAFIMDTLGKVLYMDHRDMNLNNLYIRAKPISYTILKDGAPFQYTCPFQVVLLDFGFACLGTDARQMVLNLGNVIPDIDPCPKEGRDLYHIVNRLLEPPEFATAISPSVRQTLLSWMEPTGPSLQRSSHVLTAPKGFGLSRLRPAAVLAWALGQLH